MFGGGWDAHEVVARVAREYARAPALAELLNLRDDNELAEVRSFDAAEDDRHPHRRTGDAVGVRWRQHLIPRLSVFGSRPAPVTVRICRVGIWSMNVNGGTSVHALRSGWASDPISTNVCRVY